LQCYKKERTLEITRYFCIKKIATFMMDVGRGRGRNFLESGCFSKKVFTFYAEFETQRFLEVNFGELLSRH